MPMNKVARALRGVLRVAMVLAWISLLVITVITFTEVIYRNVLNSSLSVVIGIVEVLLVVMVYAGVAPTQSARAHVAVDAFTSRLKRYRKLAVESLANLITIAVVGLFTAATIPPALEATREGESRAGLVPVPIWPARIAISIGFGLLLLLLVAQAVNRIRHDADEPSEAADGEGDGLLGVEGTNP